MAIGPKPWGLPTLPNRIASLNFIVAFIIASIPIRSCAVSPLALDLERDPTQQPFPGQFLARVNGPVRFAGHDLAIHGMHHICALSSPHALIG